jgi:hypothetical protein
MTEPRLVPHRLPELADHDRAALDALLDRTRLAHVGLQTAGGPLVVPTLAARDGDRLLLHGSTGSGWMRAVAGGAPVCVTVSELTALVVARSAFESSVHYASASIFGRCHPLDGTDKLAALDLLTEHLIPGRTAEVRRSTVKELAATLVLELTIRNWSVKVNDGWPEDGPADLAGPAWAGVVPLVTRPGRPVPAPDLRLGVPVPASVDAMTRDAR